MIDFGPSAIARFWTASLLFHAGTIACAIAVALRGAHRLKGAPSTGRWMTEAASGAVLYGVGVVTLAVGTGVFAPVPGFAVMRFLSQAMFGETIGLALWLVWRQWGRGDRTRAVLPALLAAGLLWVYFEAYHRGPHDLQVRRHPIDLSRGRAGARVLRILHLSDIQTHQIGAYEERVIRSAVAEAADMIVFTGDYIEPRLAPTAETASAALNALMRRERLSAPLGFFALEGDHDAPETWTGLFQGVGATCLVNGHVRVALPGGRSLVVIGLDATMSRGRDPEALFGIVDAAPPADLRIVAGHAPDFVQTLAGRRRVDLALAGHTHGGQIVLPFIGPPITLSRLPRRYAGGLNDYRGIPLHVSRGIGMERRVAPQVRFRCPPEICVIELRY